MSPITVPDMILRLKSLSKTLSEYMHLYGYQTFDTPVVQAADLYLTQAGDQIVSQLYLFDHDGQRKCLRPEFTVAALSQYITNETPKESQPARWQFNGTVFEDDPENVAGFEHVSVGAECLNVPFGSADAEIIALAVKGLHNVGIHEFTVEIGDIAFLRAIFDSLEIDNRMRQFFWMQLPSLRDSSRGVEHVRDQLFSVIGHDSVTHSEAAISKPRHSITKRYFASLTR
jgi:ATP phosphoribosyltransferase regulatory subunit HisZ